MAAPNSRTRSKIPLNPSKVISTSLPAGLVPQLVLSNVLVVVALDAGKEHLLARNVGVFWVLMRILACGGLGVMVWEWFTGALGKRRSIEWSVLGMASLLLFIQQACLMTALYRISAIRVVMFTHFSTFWVNAIVNRASTRQALVVVLASFVAFFADAGFASENVRAVLPGYVAVLVHGAATSALDHTQDVLSPALGHNIAMAASTLGATLFGLPFYVFRIFLFSGTEVPETPLLSLLPLPVMAYALLFLSPNTRSSIRAVTVPAHHFALSYPSTMISAAVIGPLAFSQVPSWSDLAVAVLLFYGMFPDNTQTLTGPPRTQTSRLVKSYLKTVLSNPESRKIFYFLMLNLCYMLVQMLYGVWTNSLGLISDAIHMAFDCMAIGMGLLASVMATWPPNERFTYGYGRIETLSGFANGIFLILISIFIVFEAIQRILDPPEMNTSQLLLVSSLGLGVNLFGMFAMGGHHHGHSHSHGHSHGSEKDSHESSHSPHSPHSHSHASGSHDRHNHSPEPQNPYRPDDHNHGHSHEPASSASHSIAHSHSHSRSESRSHSHSPPHLHSHTVKFTAPSPERRHSRGPSLQIQPPDKLDVRLNDASENTLHFSPRSPGLLSPRSPDLLTPDGAVSLPSLSPLTPNYRFGHDDHFDSHHQSEHVPNLHDHTHAHDRHEGHSHNMRGVFLHVMADTLGSVGVIISTLLIQLYGWTGFDPIASLFIAILIAASVIPLVIDSGKVLSLDVDEREASIRQALAELPSIDGLASYTAPRFWPKDSVSLIGSIHIQLAPSPAAFDPAGPHAPARAAWASVDKVVERVDTILRGRISGLEELTIQVDGMQN